jgi:hypothetical protein
VIISFTTISLNLYFLEAEPVAENLEGAPLQHDNFFEEDFKAVFWGVLILEKREGTGVEQTVLLLLLFLS